jgi:hypothetical protein
MQQTMSNISNMMGVTQRSNAKKQHKGTMQKINVRKNETFNHD